MNAITHFCTLRDQLLGLLKKRCARRWMRAKRLAIFVGKYSKPECTIARRRQLHYGTCSASIDLFALTRISNFCNSICMSRKASFSGPPLGGVLCLYGWRCDHTSHDCSASLCHAWDSSFRIRYCHLVYVGSPACLATWHCQYAVELACVSRTYL